MDIPERFSLHFAKRDTFHKKEFAFLNTEIFQNLRLLLKERICFQMVQIPSLSIATKKKGGK